MMMDAKEAVIAVKDYYAALKNALKPYKFDRQPPTPQLLIKAQIAANDLRSVLPRDRKGRALPYPRYQPKEEIYKKNDFGKTDSHAKNVKFQWFCFFFLLISLNLFNCFFSNFAFHNLYFSPLVDLLICKFNSTVAR